MIKDLIKKINTENSSLISVIWYIFGTFLVQGINFILSPVLTRMMNVENYGLLTYAATWVSVFTAFVTLQVHGSVNNASIEYGPERIDEYVSSVQTIGIFSSGSIILILFIFKEQFSKLIGLPSKVIVLVGLVAFLQCMVFLTQNKYVATRKHKHYFFISFAMTFIMAIATIILVYLASTSQKYLGKVYGSLVGTGVIGITALLYNYFKGKKFFSKEYTKFCLRLTLPLILHTLSQVILSQTNRFMLMRFSDNGEFNVGIYGNANIIALVINMLWQACNFAWVPWYFEKVKNGEIEKVRKVQNIYIFVFSMLTSCYILLSVEIMKIIAPESYWSGMIIVPIICLGSYFIFLYSFPVNFEFYTKRTHWVSIGTLTSALLNVILNIWLVPKYNYLGAAISTSVSYFSLFIFHYVISRKVIGSYHSSFWDLFKYSLPTLIATTVAIVFADKLIVRMLILVLFAFISVIIVQDYRRTNIGVEEIDN